MIKRRISDESINLLEQFPAVGLVGPRQSGKTTLARSLADKIEKPVVYLDLENPMDLAKLEDPLAFFSSYRDHLLVIDEIQRKPELFPVLRGVIDENRRQGFRNAQFLILGSASVDLLRQSSESLAGRIAYLELTGFTADEVMSDNNRNEKLWLRGGFPDSYLAGDDVSSFTWRTNFIATYLERDIPQFGLNVAPATLRKLWMMICHNQASPLNYSNLARSLDLSPPTIKRYIDFMEELFLLRCLQPWHGNLKKRLVKSPKCYVRDAGLFHNLLGISNHDQLLGHLYSGASWEGWVIENLLAHRSGHVLSSFFRSAEGAEIDLVLESPSKIIAIEIKKSTAPKVSKGFHIASENIGVHEKFVVYSGEEEFKMKGGVTAISLTGMQKIIAAL